MRKRIQKNMLFLIVLTLIASYAFTIIAIYNQMYLIMKKDASQEINYIKTALNKYDSDYLYALNNPSTRITWMDTDGSIIYDSWQKDNDFENHIDRKEMQEAIKTGVGHDRRFSKSIGKDMFYYATTLEDGTVLRVSKPIDEVKKTAVLILPYILLIGLILIIISFFLSKILAKNIVDPINQLDLEHPLENEVYDEIKPLLTSMENNRIEKEKNELMRKEFSANVSHELKTPLTSISGYAELIANKMVEGENISIFAKRIHKESLRLIALIDDIIKISKLDEETIEVEKEELDLYSICEEVVISLSQVAKKQQVSLELVGERVKYKGIKSILTEMIYNICDNAIKYNKKNGKVKVWVGNTITGPKISVSDTGIGIPKDDMERIYERFYRVDKSHSKETGGTGLGLSIVKHGAKLHNATFETESELNKGTTITINFKK